MVAMNWKRIMGASAAFMIVALVLSPVRMWDGQEVFTLTLTADTAANMDSLSYHARPYEREGAQLSEYYLKEDPTDMERLFEPVTVSSNRQFTVAVPTFGTDYFYGLWKKSGMYEHVTLMGKTKSGDRKFKRVSVKATEPIDMK